MGFRKLSVVFFLCIITFMNSCNSHESYLLNCSLESNEILICLNAKKGIGEIQGGSIGMLEFAKYQTNNFRVLRDKGYVKVFIENTIEYENGKDYLIDIQWFGGGVKLWSTYQNGQFIFITEEKSW